MQSNFHFHPSSHPRRFLLCPYFFERIDKSTKKSFIAGDNQPNEIPFGNFGVGAFWEIRRAILSLLNVKDGKVSIDTIGDESTDEGIVFGNSLAISVETADYIFAISVDVYTTMNAAAWYDNAAPYCK